MYYSDKLATLRRLFGTDDIAIRDDGLRVAGKDYPVVNDVIIALPEALRPAGHSPSHPGFSREIQTTFGREWERFSEILPEHQAEFDEYFDLVDLDSLGNATVCDLGCGMGRWSALLAPGCRALVLVDFSDAIFVARRNLAHVPHAVFVQADVTQLPFAHDGCDFAFSLGVLHHLPIPALDAVRVLRGLAPRLLVYLYYALDNRPAHFRFLLKITSMFRRRTSKIQNERARTMLTALITYGIYVPLVTLGVAFSKIGLGWLVPLEVYRGKSVRRIRQDVYDRFFTTIEQRLSREQILELRADFSEIRISEKPPYWHFECVR